MKALYRLGSVIELLPCIRGGFLRAQADGQTQYTLRRPDLRHALAAD
jgi:hypothetical protein